MTTQHTPLEGTIKTTHAGDAVEATCANCSQVIIEWDFLDYDDDRVRRVFEPWAVEVKVQTSPNTWRINKIRECA